MDNGKNYQQGERQSEPPSCDNTPGAGKGLSRAPGDNLFSGMILMTTSGRMIKIQRGGSDAKERK